MKFSSIQFFLLVLFVTACATQEEKDEKTARQYCASCHSFPDPSLLPKLIWQKDVLPQMAFRMGLEFSQLQTLSSEDRARVAMTLPNSPLVSNEQWMAISRYYNINAPDSLPVTLKPITDTLSAFHVEPISSGTFPLNTFVQYDSANGQLYVGSRLSKLYRLDSAFAVKDSVILSSPPSQISFSGDHKVKALLMGIMDPNDQPAGKLGTLDLSSGEFKVLIDSLKRPVYFAEADLDNDKMEDIVVCGFGNFSGSLSAFRNRGKGSYERIDLVSLPGARRVVIKDFDSNGLPDIMALMTQGDEKIMLLLNQGDFKFRVNTVLSFPPVYGSSYFDFVDMNLDGKLDILYTNGDNADYSITLKPYHGVRIFLNNGKNEFNESWFYNMHGASQALADDFDNDGDVDIAAISFFPPFKVYPEQGFIYFENTGSGYLPRVTKLAARARWLTMIKGDIDKDADTDIVLSALDFNSGIPGDLLSRWKSDKISLLVLRNNLR